MESGLKAMGWGGVVLVSSGWVVSHDAGQGLGQGVTMEKGSVSGLEGLELTQSKDGDQGELMVSNHSKSEMTSEDLGCVR